MLADRYIVNVEGAIANPETPPWTRFILELAEEAQLARGW